jgi:acyl dehydratase
MTAYYFEDLTVGQTFGSGSLTVSAEAIKAFAQQFDFQPFHLDEEAAKDTFFGELVASGWHTACLTMKLLLEGEYRPAGGFVGGKADELRWPNPTKPGDVLTCKTEILETRPSASRPTQGTVKMRTTTFNAAGAVVYVLVMNGIAKRRPARD